MKTESGWGKMPKSTWSVIRRRTSWQNGITYSKKWYENYICIWHNSRCGRDRTNICRQDELSGRPLTPRGISDYFVTGRTSNQFPSITQCAAYRPWYTLSCVLRLSAAPTHMDEVQAATTKQKASKRYNKKNRSRYYHLYYNLHGDWDMPAEMSRQKGHRVTWGERLYPPYRWFQDGVL